MMPCDDCGNEAKKYMQIKELFENTGNEAKKLLKTNHIPIPKTANYESLAHGLAPIGC